MAENLFNTFSFGVWNNSKQLDKKQKKTKKKRKQQVSKLKDYLKQQKANPTSNIQGVDMNTVLQLLASDGTGPLAAVPAKNVLYDSSSDSSDSDDDDILAEVKPEAERRKNMIHNNPPVPLPVEASPAKRPSSVDSGYNSNKTAPPPKARTRSPSSSGSESSDNEPVLPRAQRRK